MDAVIAAVLLAEDLPMTKMVLDAVEAAVVMDHVAR